MASLASSDFLTAYLYHKAMTTPNVDTFTYYVGDLCYVLSDEWGEVCDLTLDPDNDEDDREFELGDERRFIMMSTAYGDGTYLDQHGNAYSVDSGTIGAVRTDFLDPDVLSSVVERGLGHVHTFSYEIGELDCENDNGVLWFDGLCIDTAGALDEEEEEED